MGIVLLSRFGIKFHSIFLHRFDKLTCHWNNHWQSFTLTSEGDMQYRQYGRFFEFFLQNSSLHRHCFQMCCNFPTKKVLKNFNELIKDLELNSVAFPLIMKYKQYWLGLKRNCGVYGSLFPYWSFIFIIYVLYWLSTPDNCLIQRSLRTWAIHWNQSCYYCNSTEKFLNYRFLLWWQNFY